jgi:FixJ family two-component response regulator
MPFSSRSNANRDRRVRESAVSQTRARFEALTPREQEVFSLVTTGLMNKQVAGELGVSEITAKVHRGNVMRKMGARSLIAQLPQFLQKP